MSLMKDETFGPVVGMMAVENDEEALHLMNDSDYGLVSYKWLHGKGSAKTRRRQSGPQPIAPSL